MTERDRFDPWHVLGVPRGASQAEVARAYRALAKRFHPDLHGADADPRMRELNRAFQLLSDPARRTELDAVTPTEAPAAHWTAAARARSAGDGGGAAGPAAWAAWERDPAPAPSGARVRPGRGWPRDGTRGEPAAAPPRDSPLAAVIVALVIVLAIIGLGWVASTSALAANAREAFRQLGLTPASSVSLDGEHTITVFRRPDGTLGLAAAWLGEGGWQGRILVEALSTHPYSVLVFDARDAALGEFRTIAYGRAGAEVEHVELAGVAMRGGTVSNGTWAIGVPEVVAAEALTWRFVAPDGSVILAGSGELPGR